MIEVHEGESVQDGLTREVAEETGLQVTGWDGPVYEVQVVAEGLGWSLRAEVYRAAGYTGELAPADPDGIVVDARWVAPEGWTSHFDSAHPWVREPVVAYLRPGPAGPERLFRYRLDGTLGNLDVVRLGPP